MTIFLSVLSDDFGMCDAVNEGIAQAYTSGLLTDTVLMAPCPAFAEAVALAKAHRIPVGIHTTFTADWDRLRWKPLTRLRSMTDRDGYLLPSVAAAWKSADRVEAAAELDAQWQRIEAEGLAPTHVSEHMGKEESGMLAGLLAERWQRSRVPYRGFDMDLSGHRMSRYEWSSVFYSAGMSTELSVVRLRLKAWIDNLGPGHHLWLTHCAADHPSLAAICSPTYGPVHWARTYRVIDQALVMDTEVREWIERRGIRRVPLSHAPVTGPSE
jgi:chitin disaccharide deacetylase